MTTFNVSTTATLNSALASARGGDTILLSAGNYAAIGLQNVNFAGAGVTIASANPADPATVAGVEISGSSGLTFRDLEVTINTRTQTAFNLVGSSNVRLDGLDIHGADGGGLPGLLVRFSANVTVSDTHFHDLGTAVRNYDSSHVTISDSRFEDISGDGIQTTGSSNVTLAGNYFTNFHVGPGDHPDAIQFFTLNQTASVHDIVITDNVVVRGSGDIIQGVFMGNEAQQPYVNVTIAGNFLAGTMYNGISLNHARNVVVDGNVVQGFTDMTSWLDLNNIDGVRITGNSANSFILNKLTNVTNTGSTTLAQASDQGAAAYQAWLAAQDSAPPPADPPPVVSTPPAPPAAPAPASPFAGTSGADTLRGTAGADSISGQDGNDSLNGGGGADTLDGGNGADTLAGGAGVDVLRGGAGADFYILSDGDTLVEDAAGGVDLVYSYVNFTLGANIENLQLSDAAEGIGNALANAITGDSVNNRLLGLGGSDTLNGRDGADTLNGGAGADLLIGGGGADRFVLARGEANGDRIQDFAAGDRLELSGYGAGSTIAKVSGSATDWKVLDAATGKIEVIQLLNNYQLNSGDFLFS